MYKIIQADNEQLLSCCRKIRYAVFVEERRVSPAIEQDEYDVLSGACAHFLITDGGESVGALRCRRAGDIVRLQRMCVLREFRGKGAGAAAIRFVEELYAAQGAAEIRLDSKCEAQGFYEKQGYRAVTQRFIEAEIPHIGMAKILRG